MRQSGLLQKMQVQKQEMLNIGERITRQMMVDSLQIAAHQVLGLGYSKISELTEEWCRVYDQVHDACNGGPESDVAQEHVDRALEEICTRAKVPLIPFEERYPDIRKQKYGRKKKK